MAAPIAAIASIYATGRGRCCARTGVSHFGTAFSLLPNAWEQASYTEWSSINAPR